MSHNEMIIEPYWLRSEANNTADSWFFAGDYRDRLVVLRLSVRRCSIICGRRNVRSGCWIRTDVAGRRNVFAVRGFSSNVWGFWRVIWFRCRRAIGRFSGKIDGFSGIGGCSDIDGFNGIGGFSSRGIDGFSGVGWFRGIGRLSFVLRCFVRVIFSIVIVRVVRIIVVWIIVVWILVVFFLFKQKTENE